MTATEGEKGERGERETVIRNASSSKPFSLILILIPARNFTSVCLLQPSGSADVCNLHLGDLQGTGEGKGGVWYFCLQPCCQINTVCVLPLTDSPAAVAQLPSPAWPRV